MVSDTFRVCRREWNGKVCWSQKECQVENIPFLSSWKFSWETEREKIGINDETRFEIGHHHTCNDIWLRLYCELIKVAGEDAASRLSFSLISCVSLTWEMIFSFRRLLVFCQRKPSALKANSVCQTWLEVTSSSLEIQSHRRLISKTQEDDYMWWGVERISKAFSLKCTSPVYTWTLQSSLSWKVSFCQRKRDEAMRETCHITLVKRRHRNSKRSWRLKYINVRDKGLRKN